MHSHKLVGDVQSSPIASDQCAVPVLERLALGAPRRLRQLVCQLEVLVRGVETLPVGTCPLELGLRRLVLGNGRVVIGLMLPCELLWPTPHVLPVLLCRVTRGLVLGYQRREPLTLDSRLFEVGEHRVAVRFVLTKAVFMFLREVVLTLGGGLELGSVVSEEGLDPLLDIRAFDPTRRGQPYPFGDRLLELAT
jgi:hypothetical protein